MPIYKLPSSASTQLKLRLRLALFPAIPATHPPNQPPNQESSKMELQILQLNTLDTLIKKFKYLPSSVSTQFQLQLSLNSTQSQLNSTSTQTTELGTTQLNLFLMWKNVARKNVAWTNVTMTVGICSRCSQEPTFKVSSKSGQ